MQLTTAELSRFFDDEDAALEQHPEPEPFRPPARAEAPDDELPARLVQDAVIVRTDAAVVLLREVRVFSTGFELVLDWTLRRPLRFGLALPDGSKVNAPPPGFAMPTDQPEPPTAVRRHRGAVAMTASQPARCDCGSGRPMGCEANSHSSRSGPPSRSEPPPWHSMATPSPMQPHWCARCGRRRLGGVIRCSPRRGVLARHPVGRCSGYWARFRTESGIRA